VRIVRWKGMCSSKVAIGRKAVDQASTNEQRTRVVIKKKKKRSRTAPADHLSFPGRLQHTLEGRNGNEG